MKLNLTSRNYYKAIGDFKLPAQAAGALKHAIRSHITGCKPYTVWLTDYNSLTNKIDKLALDGMELELVIHKGCLRVVPTKAFSSVQCKKTKKPLK